MSEICPTHGNDKCLHIETFSGNGSLVCITDETDDLTPIFRFGSRSNLTKYDRVRDIVANDRLSGDDAKGSLRDYKDYELFENHRKKLIPLLTRNETKLTTNQKKLLQHLITKQSGSGRKRTRRCRKFGRCGKYKRICRSKRNRRTLWF